jgi:hypothetical protein
VAVEIYVVAAALEDSLRFVVQIVQDSIEIVDADYQLEDDVAMDQRG